MNKTEDYYIKQNAHFLGMRLIELKKKNIFKYNEYLKNLIEDFGVEFYNEYLKWHEEKV